MAVNKCLAEQNDGPSEEIEVEQTEAEADRRVLKALRKTRPVLSPELWLGLGVILSAISSACLVRSDRTS